MAGCKGDVSALDAALGKIGVDTGSGAGGDAPAIPAFSLIPVSGNLQTAATLAQFANPLKVQVLQQGQPMMGASVFFIITSGVSATLSHSVVTTDAMGIASVDLTAGSTPGSLTVRAYANGLSADFFETVQNPGYVLSALGGSGQTTNVSSTFNSPLTVQLLYNGSPAIGQTVNFGVLSGPSLTLSSYSGVTDSSGVASITVAAGAQSGPAVIRAAYMNRTVDFNLTVQTSGYTLAAIAGNNQSGAPGTTFGTPLRILLLNNGVPVANANVAYTVQSGGGGSFSAVTATTDSAGMAQTSFTAGGTAGPTTVRATFGAQSVDFSLNIVDQSGTVIAKISGDSQQGNIGTTLSLPLRVQVTNSSSGMAAAGILVRFQVTSGNGQLNTTNNTVTVSTDANGYAQANFDVGTVGLTNSITAGIVSVPSQVVAFNATGVIPPNSTPDLSQSRVTIANASINADGSSTTLVTLTAKDVYGNQIPAGGRTVVFSTNAGSLVPGTLNDVGDGRYTQYYRAPATTATNPATVTATVNGVALTSAPASINLLAGNISLTQSSISTSNASITADGSSTTLVTVTLRDALGNQVTAPGSQAVVIQASTGSLIGSVNSVGDGTYTQTYRAPTLSGSVTLTASVGGAPLANQGMLMLLAGAPVANNTLITATPSVILPNGTSTTLISVQPRDVYLNALTYGGHTITLTKNNGTWLSGAGNTVTAGDNGDGTYSATLKSVIVPGVARVTGTLNGNSFPGSATVYFSDGTSGPSASKSTVTLGAAVVPADGVTTTAVTVTLRDNSNNQIANGGSNVTISSTAGTLVGTVTDNQNGTYTQLLRAPASAANQVEVSASVDGATIVNKALIDFYGSISLAQSTIIASPSLVLADGTSTSTVILTAKDANGVSIPVGGVTGLALASTAGSWGGTLSDNSNGTYTRTLVAPTGAALATVSATLDGNAFSASASVQFFANNALANGTVIHCGNINTYKNTNVYMNGGTLTMDTRGPNGYCPNDFVFNSVILRGGATLTHGATTSTQEYGMEFTTPYLEIDATSKIDVKAKGYPQVTSLRYRVQGNQDVLNEAGNTQTVAGGSHAGKGAKYNDHDSPKTYGSIYQPTTMGSSTGWWWGWWSRSGSGRIKITISGTGTLLNNGSISADGDGGTNGGQSDMGSAGGSVWITTSNLTGSGRISANGGSSVVGNTADFMPGGGGRVAVYYTTGSGSFANATIADNVTAYGGKSFKTSQQAGSQHAAAGTVFLKPANLAFGNLILNNNGHVNGSTYAKTTILAPATAAPDALSSSTVTKAGAFTDTFSTTTPFIGWFIDPNTTQNATATLTDNLLFQVTSGDQNSVSNTGGGMTAVGNGSQPVALVLKFDNVDIKGGALVETNAKILSMSGDWSSQNANTVVMSGAPPAGMEFANASDVTLNLNGQTLSQLPTVFQPTGNFALNGGSGTLSLATNLSVTGFVTFDAVTLNGFGYSLTGKNFTATNSTINVDGVTSTLGNVTFDNTTATLGKTRGVNSLVTPANLILQNSAQLWQRATTATAEYTLEISAGNVTVNTGTRISANTRGYIPPTVAGTGTGFRSIGNALVGGWQTAGYGAGGSHGGRGGVAGTGERPPEAYDSVSNPYYSGASGGWSGCTIHGCTGGGGVVRIVTTGNGTVQVDGAVDVNGGDIAGNWATSHGAGGAIYISTTNLQGSGLITANGGGGTNGNSGGYGSGGGGRVAIYATTLAGSYAWPPTSTWGLRAYGGYYSSSNNSNNGGPGTVFVKLPADIDGRLVVINDSRFITSSTGVQRSHAVVNVPADAESTGLTTNSLTGPVAGFNEIGVLTNHLVGYYVNPNTAQNATTTLGDDSIYKITAQTSNVLTTGAGLTSVGASGNSFRIHPAFDEVRVIGNAILETNGVMIARSGTVSGTVLSTATPAGLALAGSGAFSIAGGTAALFDSNITGGGSLTVSGTATVNALGATLSAPSMTLTSSTIQADNLTTTSGNIVIDGSTVTLGRLRTAAPGTNYSVNAAGTLVLQNSATLQQRSTTTTAEYTLEISAANVNVGASSTISANQKGYTSPSSAGYRSFANNIVTGFSGGTGYNAGGSHGGRGGSVDTTNGRPPETYGSISNPYTSGSSGSYWGCVNNGCTNGGGIIRIVTPSTGTVQVDGTIDSSGGTIGWGWNSMSLGAGGSVYLATGTLTGTGQLTVSGASSQNTNYASNGGVGGGGRAAVYATTLSGNFAWPPTSSWGVRAYGGFFNTGADYRNGAAGTVFVKLPGDVDGRLVIINDSRFTAPGTTWSSEPFTSIQVPAEAPSTGLTSTTLTNNTANYFSETAGLTDHLVGYYLNPNITQNTTTTLADDTLYRINAQTSNALTTAANLLATGTQGNTARIHPVFDELRVLGSAVVKTNATIYAKGMTLTGTILNTGTSGGLALGGSNSITLGAGVAPIVDVNLSGSAVLSIASGANLNATGATLQAPTIVVTSATLLADRLASTAGNITIDASTVTLGRIRTASAGTSNDSVTAAGDLILQNTSNLQQRATTTTAEYSLEISAANINVGSGSTISAQARGYTSPNIAGYRAFGQAIVGGFATTTNYQAGGSHGGRGGTNDGVGAPRPPEVYGSISNPYTSGSSGSYWGCLNSGCTNGGGIIRINATGTVQVDGTIDASGGTPASGWNSMSMGAGGSVYLSTGTLTGTGQVTVTGASSLTTQYASNGGAGGGGRAAVYATTLSGNFAWPPTSTWGVRAYGGYYYTGGYYQNGGAGTIYVKLPGDNDGRLVVINDSRFTTTSSWAAEPFTPINVPAPATSSALSATTLTTATSSYFSEPAGVTDFLTGFYLNPNIAQNSSTTLADDTFYRINSYTGTVLTTATGLTSTATAGNTFRIHPVFDEIRVIGNAIVKTNGVIYAKGATLTGTVLAAATGNGLALGGNNSISLGAGTAPIVDVNLGGSAVFSMTSGANLNAQGYTLQAPSISITGATLLADRLISTTGNITLDSSTVTLGLTRAGSAGTSNNSVVAAGTLTLQNASNLFQRATTTTAEYTLEISAANVNVGSGSTISAQARGYTSPTAAGYRAFGQSIVGGFTSTTNYQAGGSHGGRGGTNDGVGTPRPPEVYGSISNPYTSGSSGSYWGCINSGCSNGGGIIRINATGTVQVDGTIDASGGTPSSGWSNSSLGAGGSVYLSTGNLTGTGQVTVTGASSLTTNYASNGGAGGGGRAAVYATTLSGNFAWPPTSTWGVRAYGGYYYTGGYYQNGGAGTIYVKLPGDVDGRLVVVNDSRFTTTSTWAAEPYTPINVPANTTSSALSSTSLSVSTANYFADQAGMTDYLTGFYLNPNTAQNATSTLADDSVYPITGYTGTTLTTTSGLSGIATSGNTFRIHPTFDDLRVLGNAIVKTNALIRTLGATITGTVVGAGSVAVNGNLGVTLGGVVPLYEVNIGGSGTLAFTSGANINAVGTTFAAPSISVTGATLAADRLVSTVGGVTLDSSTVTLTRPKGQNAVTAAGDLVLQNNATLQQATTTATTEYSLEIQAANVSVAAGSRVSASAAGFNSPATNGWKGYGNVVQPSFNGSANIVAGGSHGGRGGAYGGHYANETYGSITNPNTSGSSGSRVACAGVWMGTWGWGTNGTICSNGGGVVRIVAVGSGSNNGTITVNGSVESNAQDGSSWSTGGAGGSVHLTGGTLSGTGTVTTIGGYGNVGSGGGGRIAAHVSSVSGNFAWPPVATWGFRAYGGFTTSSQSTNNGGSGTIYVKLAGDTDGRLAILRNPNYSAASPARTWGEQPYAVINVPTSTVSTALTESTLSGAATTFNESSGQTDYLVGYYLNPKTAQNATNAVSDDTLYKITSQTSQNLVTAGDLTSIAASGDTFRVHPVFDSLFIGNGEVLLTNATIYAKNVGTVASGLLASASTGSIAYRGTGAINLAGTASFLTFTEFFTTGAVTLGGGTFNLPVDGTSVGSLSGTTANTILTGAGALTATTGGISLTGASGNTVTVGAITSPGAVNLVGGTYTATDITADSFTATNSTLTASGLLTTLTSGVTFDNTTATMGKLRSAGADGGPSGAGLAISSAGALTLQNNSILQQTATLATAEYSLEIQASGLNLAAGSRISATGRGYHNGDYTSYQGYFRSFGNVNVGGWGGAIGYRYAGGSHGGRGGSYDWAGSQRSNETYGSIHNPYTSGSAGGSGDGWGQTQQGGGIVRINVGTGDLIVNGKIEAEGATVGGSVCLGAGGSVYLKGGTLQGSGTVTANGGTWTSGGDPRGAGGGGRVAVYVPSLQGNFAWSSTGFQTYVTAAGGSANVISKQGGAGTVYVKTGSDVYGRLVIKNASNSLTTGYNNQPFTRIDVPSLTTSDAVGATSLTKAAYFTEGVGFTGHLMGFWLNANTAQNATSTVFDDVLAPVLSHSSSVLTTPSGLTSSPISAVAGSNFQLHPVFDQLKILGGAIVLTNASIITTDLEQVGTVTGTGGISLNSVANGVTLSGSTTSGQFNELTLGTGLGLTITGGAAVTLPPSITVGGNLNITAASTMTATRLNVGGNLNVDGNNSVLNAGITGTSNTTPNVVVTGDLNLTNGARLKSRNSTSTAEYYLYVTAANASIDGTSAINVDAQGYASINASVGRGLGNINYFNKAGVSFSGAGGSYGGEGGSWYWGESSRKPLSTYGSFREPIHLGSTGANWWDTNNGSGGGSARMDIPGTLSVNGQISAKGGCVNRGEGGCGSGGSIYVQAGTIAGNGTINAEGGSSGAGTNALGGGGGRIALYYTTGSDSFATSSGIAAQAKAYGGLTNNDMTAGNEGRMSGAAGTVFFKSAGETYGNLSVDNGGRVSTMGAGRTVMASTANTSYTSLSSSSSNSVTIGSAFTNQYSFMNFLTGLFVNPKTSQNSTTVLSDDTTYAITGNTASILSLSGDPTALGAQAGDPFRLVLRLDNLDVTGKAVLDFTGHDIYTSGGDISSGNANFLLDGTVHARTLDIGTGTYSMSASGVQSNLTNRCAGAVNAANGASLSCP